MLYSSSEFIDLSISIANPGQYQTHLVNHLFMYCIAYEELLPKMFPGTSLVVQWRRLQAPRQGAWVPSLVRELNPSCCNIEFECHN